MWPDYSCCDDCPYDCEYQTSHGSVCESCQLKAAERARNRMMVDLLDQEAAE